MLIALSAERPHNSLFFKMVSARVISLSIVNAFLSIFGSVMNGLVIVAIHQNVELQKGLNLLIVSLTVADLINCLVAQPMYVYYLSNDDSNDDYLAAFEIIAFHRPSCSFLQPRYNHLSQNEGFGATFSLIFCSSHERIFSWS